MSQGDLSQFSMLELFALEVESQCQVLASGLLVLERQPTQPQQLEACMRAAHSLKGAARILNLQPGVQVAHVMEDCFVAAQSGSATLAERHINLLLQGVDLLGRIGKTPEAQHGHWIEGGGKAEVDDYCSRVAITLLGTPSEETTQPAHGQSNAAKPDTQKYIEVASPAISVSKLAKSESSDRALRVSAKKLDRLLSHAGEAKVETRWLAQLADNLLRLKRMQYEMTRSIDQLSEQIGQHGDVAGQSLAGLQRQAATCQSFLNERLDELDAHEGRATDISQRLYDQALSCRMRPFGDGTDRFARMVRDLGVSLGKRVHFEIIGEATQVDRDILEKLEAPLGHLLRNAVDHGIESPAERREAGKVEEGTIQLEARHCAGLLEVSINDDGRGIDLARLRRTLLERGMVSTDTADRLSESELLDFLFLPSFSLAASVTDVSGRGVGLDVVHEMLRQVRGISRVQTKAGQGTRFRLQLPLTLSVARSLLMSISGEVYALPLAYIGSTLKVATDHVWMLEGRPHFTMDGRTVGLVCLAQVLDLKTPALDDKELSVLMIGDAAQPYGLVVDRFLGERELVVQPINPRLGKLKNISAGAVLDDGAPVLIIDVDDLMRSVDKLAAGAERLNGLKGDATYAEAVHRKRVLVVDDSLTVRELERKLLEGRGYQVEIAVDGMDGWNAVRTGQFDLVVTDVDMPRMNGVELVRMIRGDPKLKSMVVMIVSYKEREEDRRLGLEAGADYYLTKSGFQEDTLLQAVEDLIGGSG